jgi:hypothetical protein
MASSDSMGDVGRRNFGKEFCPPGRTMNLCHLFEWQTIDATWIIGCDFFIG